MNIAQRVKIKAKFLPILRWTFLFAIALVVVGLFIGWLKDADSIGPSQSGEETRHLIVQVVGWGVAGIIGFALLLYGFARFTGISVTASQISGRSYWGFKVRFPPNSITEVTKTQYQGVPYLWVSSNESPKQICQILLGVHIEEYAAELSRVIGSENELTKWFCSNS